VLNGIVLLNNGKFERTRSCPSECRQRHAQKTLSSVTGWARSALAKGDAGLAEKSFRQAAQLNPHGIETSGGNLRALQLCHGDMNLLSDVAEKAIAAAPRFPGGYIWRGYGRAGA